MKRKQHFPLVIVRQTIIGAFSWRISVITVLYLQLVFSGVTAERTDNSSCANSTSRLSYNSNSSSSTNNTIAPSDMKPVDVNIGFLTSISNRGSGKFYGGAFFLAIEKLHEIAAADNIPVRFNWTFRDTANAESRALKEVSDLHCTENISALVGPDIYCKSAGLLATGFNIPYITFNCQDNYNETGELLLVNTETSFVYISRFITAVLQHYQWKSFWLVTGMANKWRNVAKHLRATVASKNISINGESPEGANDAYAQRYYLSNPYKNVIETSKHATRVYVFLGNCESLLLFLRELAALDLTTSGEYAVITADDIKPNQLETTFYLTQLETKMIKNMSEEEKRKMLSTFRNVLVLKQQNPDINWRDFEDAVFNRSVLPPINLTKPPRNYERPNIPNQAYQLYDATMFYGRAVMKLMSIPGADPENASQIINYLRCRFHDSIQGNKIFIHYNGESEGSYKVESLFIGQDNKPEPRLWEVGTFKFEIGEELVYVPNNTVMWAGGHPPVSDPTCGFDGKLCRSSQLSEWKIACIIIGVFIFVLFVVIILILGLRHYMYEKKLEKLAWKIEREDIQMLNAGQFMVLTTPSRPRKKDSFSGNQLRSFLISQDSDPDIISEGSCTSYDIPLGVYKGTNVAIRKLTRKHLELNRALKKQLQLRKELTHENINRFIGACIEIPYVYMVAQYCPRKSLQDILRNEDSPLDDMFITSLVQDLIRGMTFIHDNEIGYHGNLKSSNCLVDSRWTLKISDFGLSALGPPDNLLLDDEEYCRELLWTAPELLRCCRRSSNSSGQPHHFYHGNHNNNINNNNSSNNSSRKNVTTGSQKGDVYSFAIILYELYGKSGPWGQTKMTSGQIIDSLLSRATPVLRPDTSSLTCDMNVINLMCSCWDNDPDIRPDFKYGIRNRFKPIQQGLLKSNIFDNMLAMMEKYANNLEAVVAERTQQLRLEKKMTENLLLRMLPRSVAEKLKRGQRVEAEQFEQVSIYFSDIVGFTELSAGSTPMEVVDLLNDLYTCFDSIIEEFDVYKVETIGDAYMVVSGLPIRNGDRHAGEIASMSLLLLEAIRKKQFRIRGSTDNLLKIRIGIHSGPCCAGVVGLKMPRYCLFGDTVNTASRLESTGEALKIHCSADCKKILDKLGGYTLEERGYTEMKGKGSLLTYFLLSEDQHQRYKRIFTYSRMGSDGRCVSASNLDYSGKIYSIGGNGLPYVNFHNTKNPLSKNPTTNNQTSFTSLNTSIDSTWSELPEDVLQHQLPNIHRATSAFPHDFISSTLPRASYPKYNSPQMSPIAEDPSSFGDRSLEKTVSFPNSNFHESNTSESDALLGGVPGILQDFHNNISPSQRTQSSRSVFIRASKTGSWKMESFDEDNGNIEEEACQSELCDSSRPETIL